MVAYPGTYLLKCIWLSFKLPVSLVPLGICGQIWLKLCMNEGDDEL
ncbi:hypothetical protein ACP8HZ_08290 [Francisella noatunensis]